MNLATASTTQTQLRMIACHWQSSGRCQWHRMRRYAGNYTPSGRLPLVPKAFHRAPPPRPPPLPAAAAGVAVAGAPAAPACCPPPAASAAPATGTSNCRTAPPRRSRGATRRYPLATRCSGLLLLLLRKTRTGLPPTKRRRCSSRGRRDATSSSPSRRLGRPRSLGSGGWRDRSRRSVI